jgi:DNA invertase Pin-like site-specific DNA recombinase
MNALKPRPRFQVLIMSEESRLGREAIETAYALKQIVTSGVRVFFYLEDRERTLDSPTDKIMLSLTAFADELEREKARQRTYDAMLRKARAGHVTGGRVFGYDNIEVTNLDGRRSHVERRTNDSEAEVVRKIFDLCAAGSGYTRIAKLLNGEGAPSPRPQQGRPAGGAPTSIKEILDRRLYLGEVVWNRTKKRDKWGQLRASSRPEEEWLRQSVPALRIISDAIWKSAHDRLTGIRERLQESADGAGRRRHGRDVESRHLLAGFARCAICGGSFAALSRSHGRERAFFYGCAANHKRGHCICGNNLVMRVETIEDAVLHTLGGEALRPAVVMAVIDGVADAFDSPAIEAEIGHMRGDLQDSRRAVLNLTQAIATGGNLEPLLAELKTRQARCLELEAAIATRERNGRPRFDRRVVEQRVRHHLRRWRGLLTRHVQDGRQLLREALEGPLRFTPEGQTYRFEGEVAVGRLLAGTVAFAPFVASPTSDEETYLDLAIVGDLRRAA